MNVRQMQIEDVAFVMSSWKRSWRTSPWAGVIRNDEYYASITSTIDGLIARGATILVATPDDRPDRILGWVCYEVVDDATCIHYLYVKDAFLRMGIGAQLVEQTQGAKPGTYSFRAKQVVEACPGWRHRPEVARRK
jgi:GNAT superfamily N-acetyltransferase